MAKSKSDISLNDLKAMLPQEGSIAEQEAALRALTTLSQEDRNLLAAVQESPYRLTTLEQFREFPANTEYFILESRVNKLDTLSNQHLILENSKEQIDSAFYDAINLSNHLQLNSYINMLAHGKCAVDSTPALDRHYLSGDLKMLQVSNALIQQLNVYFPASDYIVTAASAHEMSMLPYMDNVGISFQDWQQILEELDGTHIVCMTPENSSCLVLAKTLQSDIHGAPLAVMAVQLDRERLIHKLQNDLFPEFGGVFALIKTDGVLLSSDSGSAVLEELSFPSIFTFFEISRV